MMLLIGAGYLSSIMCSHTRSDFIIVLPEVPPTNNIYFPIPGLCSPVPLRQRIC